jgi:Yip1 domain
MADLTGRMIGAMQADVKILEEIEADPNAMTQAVTVIVIAGIAALIGNIFRSGVVVGVTSMVASLLGYALFSFLVFLIGTKVMPEPATKADFSETFRTVGFAAAPGVFNILAIIPVVGVLVGMVIGLWSLVIAVIAVRAVLDYSNTGRAIIVCLLAFVACMIVWFVVAVPIMAVLFVARAATGG